MFHSVSALVALADQMRTARFAALVLLDPPLFPPGGSFADLQVVGRHMAHRARRRSKEFQRQEELAESLRRSRALRNVLPGVLELFSETTLRIAPGGTYQLCCPPDYEAQIYETLFQSALPVQRDLKDRVITSPIKSIGSDPTTGNSFMPSIDLSTLAHLDYDFVPDTTHFLQLENPKTCAAATIEFLEQQSMA